jgi:putative ABC transport system permease protein
MRTPLAWLNLAHHKTRTGLAVAGVVFAVVLIFMQLGFLGSAASSASVLYDALSFDILLRSRRYLYTVDSRTFPKTRLYQAASVPGVEQASPFYIFMDPWRNPRDGTLRLIMLMGVEADAPPFRLPELHDKCRLLTLPDYVLIDRESRSEFGPQNGRRFSDADIGVVTEVNNRRVEIVGHFGLGTGFSADGAIVLNEDGFMQTSSIADPEQVSLGLIKLSPGASLEEVTARLNNALPEDVEAVPRDEAIAYEVNRWVHDTSLGVIFQLGVAVSLVVGAAIVYQVLSSDVANHLPEYATLKAIGYSGNFLAGVVLQQAVLLALVGFVPGLALAEILYVVARQMAHVPITMPLDRVWLVLALSLGMCTVSGLGALRKLRTADPADLY